MGERDEWSWLDRWMNQTEAEFRAVRQHVKARGYPQGWTESRRELGTFGGPRYVIGPVELDEDDVLQPWSLDGVRDPEDVHERHANSRQQETDEQAGQSPEQGARPGRVGDPAHEPGQADERSEQDEDGHGRASR